MTSCAISLHGLINICHRYSIEIDHNSNTTKSYCIVDTLNNFKLLFPDTLFTNKLFVFWKFIFIVSKQNQSTKKFKKYKQY